MSWRWPMVRKILLSVVALAACASSLYAQDAYERMARGLMKKMTVEFVDTKLSDALELVATATNVNIIIHPRLRTSNPTVNLKVTDMDAGTLIKWLTELTDTHADLKDQA